jgi:hypothetical protein
MSLVPPPPESLYNTQSQALTANKPQQRETVSRHQQEHKH